MSQNGVEGIFIQNRSSQDRQAKSLFDKISLSTSTNWELLHFIKSFRLNLQIHPFCIWRSLTESRISRHYLESNSLFNLLLPGAKCLKQHILESQK